MIISDLTKEEESAIRRLKTLEKVWPSTLWLYSASGTLQVMKYLSSGERSINSDGGMDDNAIVATIMNIDNDGGDW